MVTVRAAVAEDADAIGRVQVETWRVAYRGLMPRRGNRGLRRRGSPAAVARRACPRAAAGQRDLRRRARRRGRRLRERRPVTRRRVGERGRAVCDLPPPISLGRGDRPRPARAGRGVDARVRLRACSAVGDEGKRARRAVLPRPPAGSPTAARSTRSRAPRSSSCAIARLCSCAASGRGRTRRRRARARRPRSRPS